MQATMVVLSLRFFSQAKLPLSPNFVSPPTLFLPSPSVLRIWSSLSFSTLSPQPKLIISPALSPAAVQCISMEEARGSSGRDLL